MFTPQEKSSFKYYFAHLCAYNMTALNLGCWKWKYLFHDAEKPWLKLLLRDYKKVRNFHRKHNKHHLQYKNPRKIDWEALIIDWECSRFTKLDSPRTALDLYNYTITTRLQKGEISKEMVDLMKLNMPPIFQKLKLNK